MKGAVIRIDRSSDSTGICFAQLFSPFLECVAKLYWITLHYQSSPFANGMAGIEAFRQVEDFRIDVEGLAPDTMIQLYRPPALEQLAIHVRNDWQDFLGIKRGLDPMEVTKRFALLDERADFGCDECTADFTASIEKETELVFFSDDSGVWEMYAVDSSLQGAVMSRCRELGGGVRVQPTELANRDRVLSSRW